MSVIRKKKRKRQQSRVKGNRESVALSFKNQKNQHLFLLNLFFVYFKKFQLSKMTPTTVPLHVFLSIF